MVEPYLNQVGGKVDNDVSLFTGGLNTYEDKAFLESNQMPYVMNMSMYKPPMMCTRPARKTLAYDIETGLPFFAEGVEITNMYAADEDTIFTIATVNNTAKFYVAERDANGYFVQTHIADLPAVEDYYFCDVGLQNQRYLYIGNENFKARYNFSENPLALPRYDDSYNDHFGIPCWHKNRLWLVRPTDNTLEWSNAYKPDDFLIGPDDPQTPTRYGDSGELQFTANKGNLKTVASFDDKLVVFCEHSMHVIYGHSGEATDQNYFQVVDVNNNLGCHSAKCVAQGGGRLFWLGDDYEVYEYTGSAINIVSRPGKTRNSTLSIGGISNIFSAEDDIDFREKAQMTATANKLYFNVGWASENKYLFVFDIFNRTWWCEDGEFNSIANYSTHTNKILMARKNGDIVVNYERWNNDGVDYYFDYLTEKIVGYPIEYEFHTRVYGADGVDLRKTLNDVWFQARATAKVYINDIWTSHDKWAEELGDEQFVVPIDENYREIGTLKYEQQSIEPETRWEKYRPETYEQQVCYVEKMYGQRLNAFQIIVKGEGASKFYLMKREWRAR